MSYAVTVAMHKTMKLPATLANYIEAANAGAGAAAVEFFSESAVVQDEGAEHRGHAAIRAWIEETAGKYQFRIVPLAMRQSHDHRVLRCRVSGNFPGSPAELDFDFVLSEGKIVRLAIQ